MDPKTQSEPEIAHVLLMDFVGYSKLLVDQQVAQIRKLNQIVRGCDCFQRAERSGKLKRLPTGDGMALLFYDSPEAPVRCALEISEAVARDPEMQLRLGVHSGPIRQVTDVNDGVNVAGAGIDTAQRVMDCGDAGHILVSKRVADDLSPMSEWHASLHDLGECEVKHGAKLHLFNLWQNGAGNPAVPSRIKEQRTRMWRARSWMRRSSGRRRTAIAGIAFCVLIIAPLVIFLSTRPRAGEWRDKRGRLIPEKAIAILPLENFSADPANAYLASGIHDDLLTLLSKFRDLWVTSRTSVMQYAKMTANVRDVARELGVTYVLEGTVRRTGDRIGINAQLIDARTDKHVAAQLYERDAKDLVSVEQELAASVAKTLGVALSPSEKQLLEEPVATNIDAYALYQEGKKFATATTFNARAESDLPKGAALLEQATKLEPEFFPAYYQLARVHDQIYWLGIDPTPARLALAQSAVEAARRLKPDAGETHLAMGEHLYWGYRKYDEALQEFAKAQKLLPNDTRPILLTAYIHRRMGRAQEALEAFEHALSLDPLNLNIHQQLSLSYQYQRRYREMAEILDRAIGISSDNLLNRVQRATVDLEERADVQPLQRVIATAIAADPAAGTNIADSWFYVAMSAHDAANAERALGMMLPNGCGIEGVLCPREWCVGMAALARGDRGAALQAFRAAHLQAEKKLQEQPDYAEGLSALGLIEAGLGNRQAALEAGQRSIGLLPITVDAVEGAVLLQNLAIIYAWTGERDRAIETISEALKHPGPLSYGNLKLHPYWDPLRGDPRFEQIVASLAPK
ncbi:MAG: hypothetical protein ACJ8KX_03265 [Chthoniobacterales bacterium]